MLLNRKRIGLVLRAFASKEADVPKRIEQISDTVTQAASVRVGWLPTGWHPVFSRIDILVWEDKRYKDADCGATAKAMPDVFFIENTGVQVAVHRFTCGDLFCGCLNYGVALQLRNRIAYSCIMSTEAAGYLTEDTATQMIAALEEGAKVTGIAINELTESVCEGRIANTLAIWDNVALMSVGGFDLRAAKPRDERTASYMRGWNQEKGGVYYHLAGCEEVIPLARLVDTYGPCIAPILPADEAARYKVPDPKTEPELWLRHISKMGTKLERQSALLASAGYDTSFLRGGVMPKYRKF